MDFGGGSFGGAFTWAVMRGKEVVPSVEDGTIGNSDLLFYKNIWNGVDWDVHLNILNLVDGAVMIQTSAGGSPPYAMSNSPFNTETLMTIPRPFAGEDFIIDNWAYDQSDNGIVIWGRTGANNSATAALGASRSISSTRALTSGRGRTPISILHSASRHLSDARHLGRRVGLLTQPEPRTSTVARSGGCAGTMLYTNPAIYVADLNTGNITIGGLASPLGNYVEGNVADELVGRSNAIDHGGAPSHLRPLAGRRRVAGSHRR
jgi:hypothetical protein